MAGCPRTRVTLRTRPSSRITWFVQAKNNLRLVNRVFAPLDAFGRIGNSNQFRTMKIHSCILTASSKLSLTCDNGMVNRSRDEHFLLEWAPFTHPATARCSNQKLHYVNASYVVDAGDCPSAGSRTVYTLLSQHFTMTGPARDM